MSPAKQMQMQVIYGLPTICAGIGHDPVAAVLKVIFAGKLCSNQDHMTDQGHILFGEFGCTGDMLPRHNQNVDWRGWIDIMNSDHFVVLERDL